MKIESKIDRQGRTTIPAAVRALLVAKPGDRLHWQVLGSGLLHAQLHRRPVGTARFPKKKRDHA